MDWIRCEGVAIGYGRRVVAKGLDMELRGGELTCLIGRNGLGKSTLLKVLAGFLPPLIGKITAHIAGQDYDFAKMQKGELARIAAVVLTDKVDIANATAREIVGLGRTPYTGLFGTLGKEDNNIVNEAMRLTGIEGLADRDIGTLSDGERQKVMIARALAQQTPAILLDEPTAFLDYDSKTDTMRLLGSLAHGTGKIILASTHDLGIAVRAADRMITIADGIVEVDKTALRQKLNHGENIFTPILS